MGETSIPEIKEVCQRVNIPVSSSSSKVCKDLQYTTKDTFSEKKSNECVHVHCIDILIYVFVPAVTLHCMYSNTANCMYSNTANENDFLQPQLLCALEQLHSFVIQGKSECHVFEAAPACTGGKVFKNCHHQVH